MHNIYLDVCALCRPYDDQSYSRIHLETVAVYLILKAVENGLYSMIASPVHRAEISAIGDDHERTDLLYLLDKISIQKKFEQRVLRRRAEKLFDLGFGPADAAHLAFAEEVQADFISCDDKLIKKCAKLHLTLWVGNPIAFCDKEDLR